MTTVEDLLRRMGEVWDDPAALGAVGRELHDRNRLDHARAALEHALEGDPSDAESWAHLSYCHFRSLADGDGMEVLRRGFEATDDSRLLAVLSHFTPDADEKERLKATLAERDDPYAKAGILAHRANGDDPRAALDAMSALADAHPDEAEVHHQLCWTLLGLRSRNATPGLDLRQVGIPVADRLIARDPHAVMPHWMKVQMLLAEKDWPAVLDATEEALARFPDEETQMQFRARALRETGDLDGAVHWYARAIGAKPSFAGARVELGKLYEQLGKPELAEFLFRELPRANPAWPLAPISLALFLTRQGRVEEAESLFLDAWPGLHEMYRRSIREHPDARALLERPAVRTLVEAS